MEIEKKPLTRATLKKVPEEAGVYIFWSQVIKPIYIGKAINLKRRLDSYVSDNLSPKTLRLMAEAKFFSIVKVNSELEALLLEAKLVKLTQPKYNSQLKDDKHPLYIRITKEKYPRVATARKLEERGNLAFIGPFPSSANVKSVLKTLRHIFPYAQHLPSKRACLDSQIGLCNPCPSAVENLNDEDLKTVKWKSYRKNIQLIRLVLLGRIKSVRFKLEREMQTYARKEKFEKATLVREQIKKLDYITQPVTPIASFLKNPNLVDDIRNEELKQLRSLLLKHLHLPKRLSRIECFDVAHLAGSAPAASMVTFIDGDPEKSFYRHFRIRQTKAKDDIASLKEVITRRASHFADWGKPDLIIVDGGKPQTAVFLRSLEGQDIPVVGLAKRFETLVIPQKIGSTFYLKEYRLSQGSQLNLLQRIRNEAHRFAQKYHHQLIARQILGKKLD